MAVLLPEPVEADDSTLLSVLVEAPALSRTLYRRGGFEELEPNVLQVLVALHRSSGRTVGELTDELALGQGTVSTALGVLAERGFVIAKADTADRRRQLQSITRSGRGLVNRFLAQARERLSGRN